MLKVTARRAAWVGAAIVVVALAAAAYLFASGNSLAAIKVLLGVLVVPGLVLFAVAGYMNMRRPNWYRDVGNVGAVMFLWGCVLVLGPIMLYMPWAPARFPLDEMPLGLPVILWIGAPVAAVGSVLGMAWSAWTNWREGDRWRAVGEVLLLAVVVFVIAFVVAAPLGGG